MEDLISRSALLEDIRNNITEMSGIMDWLKLIDRQPTAYNVDKVVEQLADLLLCDGCSECTNCFELNKRSECNSYKAIEKIVKAGGVE